MEISWTYEERDINELVENEDNPRVLSKRRAKELKKSLRKFGICQPIVIQPDGKVIGGHQRLKTLKLLGVSSIHVAVPSRNLSREEFNELTLRLNKNVGDWDYDLLANNWDYDLLIEAGFTEAELHSDVIPEEKPKKYSINIKFDNEEDLRHLETELQPIIDLIPSAIMKVRAK